MIQRDREKARPFRTEGLRELKCIVCNVLCISGFVVSADADCKLCRRIQKHLYSIQSLLLCFPWKRYNIR